MNNWRSILSYKTSNYDVGDRVRLKNHHISSAMKSRIPAGTEGVIMPRWIHSDGGDLDPIDSVRVKFDWMYPLPSDSPGHGADTGWRIMKRELELI